MKLRGLSLAALSLAAMSCAASANSAESPVPGAGSAYRTLVLANTAKAADTQLLPMGILERHLTQIPNNGSAVRINWRKMTIPAGPNGHFFVTARVKKQPPSYSLVDIHFLVDTGASLVALTRKDAEALGFNMRELEFSGVSHTANGEVRYAAVVLPELRVGSFKVKNVSASVVDGAMDISLLGNSFLGQLKSYQVSNDELVMRW